MFLGYLKIRPSPQKRGESSNHKKLLIFLSARLTPRQAAEDALAMLFHSMSRTIFDALTQCVRLKKNKITALSADLLSPVRALGGLCSGAGSSRSFSARVAA